MVSRSIIDDLRERMLHQHKNDPFWSVFGLKESPFQVVDNIDAKYFYESSNHKELINKLHSYIIHEAAYIYVVTGLAGVGKTFTYNVFANRFIAQQEEFRRVMLEEGYTEEQINMVPVYQTMRFQNTTYGDAGEQINVPTIKKYMLQQLNPQLKSTLDTLDVYHNPHHKEKVHNLWMDTMVQLAKRNRVLILFIDEAQGLALDIIRSIRLMAGINESMLKHVLTVVYIGTIDLMEKMNSDDAIRSRLNEHFLLKPLDRKETGEMIRFRLSVASQSYKMVGLIPDEVIDILFDATGGIPRSIFQKLSSAFRILREKHIQGDSTVQYLSIENKVYPMLTKEVFNELIGDQVTYSPQIDQSNKISDPILKLTDDELIDHILNIVSKRIGFMDMKISKNAWCELLSNVRNQVLTVEDIIAELIDASNLLTSRYTIQRVVKLVKTKVGEQTE